MGAFLTALLSTGNQLGEAKSQVEEERLARQEKFRSMNMQDAYLQLAKQREAREAAAQKEAMDRGEIFPIRGRLWSVKQNKFIDPTPPDPYDAFKDLLATVPSELKAGAIARMRAVTAADPNNPRAGIDAGLAYLNTQQAESNRQKAAEVADTRREAAATLREENAEKREATRERERREDAATQRTESYKNQKALIDDRLNAKSRYMNAAERQQWESIKNLEPMVEKLTDFLEDNKLTGENGYVFGNHSALMQHIRMRGYKAGVAQEAITQELIKDAAAIQIMGVAPWTRAIGRSKANVERITQHLPSPTDTPGNLYDKITWLRDNILVAAKHSLEGLTPPGETSTSPDQGADPLNINKLLGTKDVEQGPK
jgi:hypothetical protein